MLSKAFWLDAVERAVRTGAQAIIALWGAGVTGILDVDWMQTLSVAGMAAAISLLTSIAASGIGVKGSPSILPEVDGDGV